MGEPLKDKRLASLGTSNYTMNADTIVYFERDIKSAVGWLKSFFEDKERYNAEYIKCQIDEAFPDLQKVTK